MENNKLIAEFMGPTLYRLRVIREEGGPELVESSDHPLNKFNQEELDLSKSVNFSSRLEETPIAIYNNWNDLMPVIRKLDGIIDESKLDKESTVWYIYHGLSDAVMRDNLPELHLKIVILIKWYNKGQSN